jgi:hypothetical protein
MCIEEPWRSALLKAHTWKSDSMHDYFDKDRKPETEPIVQSEPSDSVSSRGQLITTRWISKEAEKSIDKFNETYIPESDESVMSSPRDLAKKIHIEARRKSQQSSVSSSEPTLIGFHHGVPQYGSSSSSKITPGRSLTRTSSKTSDLDPIQEEEMIQFTVREETPAPIETREALKSRPIGIQFGQTEVRVFGKSTPEDVVDLNSPDEPETESLRLISNDVSEIGGRSSSVTSILGRHQSPDNIGWTDTDLNQYKPREIKSTRIVHMRQGKKKNTKRLISSSQSGLSCLSHQSILFNRVRKIWEIVSNDEVVNLLESLMYSRYQEITE